MRLLNQMYTITGRETLDESTCSFAIHLDAEHFIYKAHFPGEPITPGVCIMQIAKELMAEAVASPLQLDTVKNIKFLRIISPLEVTDVTYTVSRISVEDDCVKAQITVQDEQGPYAKLSLVCRKTV